MKMEGSGVLKKKSSSGCLIIKKTGSNKNSGGGLGGLSDSSKEKKRVRLVASDSSSSDEDESLEIMRRRVNDKRLKNGSMGYKRNELENREHVKDNAGIGDSAERKRSRMDLFEFDEYDEFDGKKMRNEFSGGQFKTRGKMKEPGVSSTRNFMVDKQKHGSRFDGSSSGKSKGKGLEDDEANMPISLLKLKYQEKAGESIRLQGKNGVLKVMVNKKKKVDFSTQLDNCEYREIKERKGLRSDGVVKKDLYGESPVCLDSKTPENRSLISVERKKKQKGLERVEPASNKGRMAGDSEVDGSDKVLKLATPRPEASSSKKGAKKDAEGSLAPEKLTPVKVKESKDGSAKRGGSTEKQMLREKIRGMLLDAGWTIDYRPRRNRDYLDAVYINPSGTAYWSIIKAYDAFKKHLEEDDRKVKASIGSPSVAPLSEDLINKLTRQTKKKIAEEIRRKRKEDAITKSAKRSVVREASESSDSDQSEERLSSYIKQKQKSRGKLSKVDRDSEDDLSDDLSDDSPKRKPKKIRVEKPSSASNSSVLHGRTSKVTGRCTLLVRGSDRGANSDFDGYVPYSGKRTLLAWLIDSGTAKLSEKVQYMNRRRSRVMLEGWITRDGIHCGCCSKILTVSKFELHAGSKLRQPFQNIFLESGSSLLQCQIDAWNRQEESECRDFFTVDVDGDDPDDDTCGICGDGGDLICCDTCPSTFHQICLGIKMLPSGDWHCPNCTCKFCGHVSGNVSEENNSADDEINRCHFCEKRYHKSCSKRAHARPMSSNGASFCGPKCQEINDHLEKILGIKHELEAGISWSLIQRKDVSDASQRGFPLRVECNSKLAVALSVMDECFLPIIDRRSGINMIHNVVYNCGSNFNRLNFDRFYTAVLERGDEIICAASIRLHGDRLAEMPFIGTREIYRRQGMCRRLLSAIETELRSLKVGQLIIPAISEHMNTWTTVFDFHELKDAHKKEIKSLNMLVFPGTDMLQKQLVMQENTDGPNVSESTYNQPRHPISVEKSEVGSSPEQNRRASSDSEGSLEPKTESDNPPDVSNTVCDSDIHNGTAAAFKPEVENKQKEPSDNSKRCPSPAENNSSDNKQRLLEPSEDACKNKAPCLKSIPDSSEQSSKCGTVWVSEDADNQKPVSNGCVRSGPGSVFEVSSENAIGTASKNQDSDEENAGPNADLDHKALLEVKSDDMDRISVQEAIVGPETGLLDGRIKTNDHPKTDKSNGEIEAGDCPIENVGSNADLDHKALLEAKSDEVDQSPVQEAVGCPETDMLDGGIKTIDRSETDKPDGEIETGDCPVENVGPNADLDHKVLLEVDSNDVDQSPVQEAVDCPETGTLDGGIKTIDRPETDKPDGEIETDDCFIENVGPRADLDHKALLEAKSVDVDRSSIQEAIDPPETGMLDGGIKNVDCPKTDKPDGEMETGGCSIETVGPNADLDHKALLEAKTDDVDRSSIQEAIERPETGMVDAEIKTIDCPETDKPDGEIEIGDGPVENVDHKALLQAESDGVDGSPVQEAVDRPETSILDGGINTIDHPSTDKPDEKSETDKSDGEIETVDHPKTDKPNGEIEIVDCPETGKKHPDVVSRNATSVPSLPHNEAATQNHVQ